MLQGNKVVLTVVLTETTAVFLKGKVKKTDQYMCLRENLSHPLAIG